MFPDQPIIATDVALPKQLADSKFGELEELVGVAQRHSINTGATMNFDQDWKIENLWASVFLSLSLVLLWPSWARGEGASESEKLKRMSQLASGQPFVVNKRSEEWCPAFLRELIDSDMHIHPIDPLFSTEDKNDSRLQKYHSCMAGTKRRQSLGDDPEANFWVIDDVGHRAFRLYELPAGSSGKSIEVLYGELNWKSAFSNQDPGYSIIDFDRCGFEDHVPVQQALRYGGRSLNNSNVLIGYRDVYYVLDMYDERTGGAEPIYALDLTRIPRAGRRGYSCSWTRTPSSVIK